MSATIQTFCSIIVLVDFCLFSRNKVDVCKNARYVNEKQKKPIVSLLFIFMLIFYCCFISISK